MSRYERKFFSGPLFRLPAYAQPTGDFTPAQATEARVHALHVARHPLFWLESPGSRELRTGFTASFDRTLLVTYSHGSLLQKLLDPKRDRETNRLGELLARLLQGGHLALPGSRKVAPQIVQARLGLIATTDRATLHQALTCDREDVRTLLSHSVLVDATNTAAPSRAPIQNPGASWHQLVAALLENRRYRQRDPRVHFSCYERLSGWSQRLHELREQTPEPLHRHLVAFTNLPLCLTSLFLAVGTYGVWRDAEAAGAALAVTEWLLARTLLVVADARTGVERTAAAKAKERMLAKIVELGPVDFWQLCRHYDRQDKAIHEPVLHALLEERRVSLNPEGRLVAA